jgi:H+/Cl- antiporter ClcA
MEEVATAWSTPLLWMIMVSSFWSCLIFNIFTALYHGNPNDIGGHNLVVFGHIEYSDYHIWEIIYFCIIGVIGGVLGGFFNWLNEHITSERKKYIWGRNWRRWGEAVAVTLLTATLFYWAPMMFDDCRDDDNLDNNHAEQRRYNCSHGNSNALATLTIASIDEQIKNLFHNESDFGVGQMFVYFILVLFLAILTYGIAIPSGLIDPALLIGGAYGRLIG